MVKAIKFYADWCGPCKTYDTIWQKVKKDLKEEVEYLEINVDKDTTGLAAKYKVLTPSLHAVKCTSFINLGLSVGSKAKLSD